MCRTAVNKIIMCRTAVNKKIKTDLSNCNKLFCNGNSRAMWNYIKKCRNVNRIPPKCISNKSLVEHYSSKFLYDKDKENCYIIQLRNKVKDKLTKIKNIRYNFTFSDVLMKKYIKKLKGNCAVGIDGICAEHLKYAIHTNLVMHLCNMFSICFNYGVTPSNFSSGILIPLLKKATLDLTVANNYRPVIISTTFSKIMEMHILQLSDINIFNDFQFGFVPSRSTTTAISLLHDVGTYCVNNDAIPFPVLFAKSMNIIPDICWRLLYKWYNNMNVRIKWYGPSRPIVVSKGTKQGGLTSPYLFNIFYRELIEVLSKSNTGIIIENKKYNVFCYADDILLSSTTITGLQTLIDVSVNFIEKHGLRFNPIKTSCFIRGKHPFCSNPKWYINGEELVLKENVNYLGAILSNHAGNNHVAARCSICRKTFYSLKNAGLCFKGLQTDTKLHIFSNTCRNSLSYACEAMFLSSQNIKDLDNMYSKLLKQMLGLGNFCKNTPLFQAVMMQKISDIIDFNNLTLFSNIFNTHSGATGFNLDQLCNKFECSNTLYSRVNKICMRKNVNIVKFIFDNKYKTVVKKGFFKNVPNGSNGIVDSLRYVLSKAESKENVQVLKLLLKSF